MSINTLCDSYLMAISRLQNDSNEVRSVDIAKELGYSRASINYAVGHLKKAGFVTQERYKHMFLTIAGKERVKEIMLKRILMEDFFINSLKVDRHTATKQAKKIEVNITDEILVEIKEYLDE